MTLRLNENAELNLAWMNPDGKVNAQFRVQIRHQTEPPSVPKYMVRILNFTAARWSNIECDNCGAEAQAELPPHIAEQVERLLGTTVYVPQTLLENKLTFYIDPPKG